MERGTLMDVGNVLLNELLDLTEWSYILREDTRRLVYANSRILEEFGDDSLRLPWDDVFAGTFYMRLFNVKKQKEDYLFWELADGSRNEYLMVRNRWITLEGVTYCLGTVSSASELSGVSKDMARLTVEYRAVIEEKQRLLGEVEWFAFHDQLTRLGNRNKFMKDSEALFSDCKGLGLINIDINNLKKINDNYGHLAGDWVIGRMGSILAMLAEEEGTYCYRMGGDEFLLVRRDCGESYLEMACGKIRDYLRNSQNPDRPLYCEAAMGIAVGEAGMHLEKLQMLADARMYEDKRAAARQ